MDFGKGGLAAMQHIANRPRCPEGTSEADRLSLLLEEAAVMDGFMAYAYAYDNHDLDAVLDFFTDDCVIDNPRGQVVGAAAIRANYQVLFGYWDTDSRHAWSNVAVRFLDPARAYVTAYHNAVLVSDRRTLAGAGTDIRLMHKVDGSWKIARRWITDDVDYTIDIFREAVEDPDKVEDILRQVSAE